MKIVITGGHPAPALALIDSIRAHKDHAQTAIVFVGRKYNNERERTLSYEYKEIKARSIPFIHLVTGRLTRLVSLRTLRSLLLVPVGFVNAYLMLKQERPDVVMSFGGYLALPVAYAAYIMKIPVYTHEQTIHPGLANRLIAKVASNVFVSFEESVQYFKNKNIVVTGNIVRDAIFEVQEKLFPLDKSKNVIYVTGGSLGSHSVNIHIEKLLPELLKKYTVVHQTGNLSEYNDFKRLWQLREELPDELKNRYFVTEHVSAAQIGYMYAKADLVIGRSGANTLFEIIALQKPAILIPLPWSAHNEQQKQAELLEKAGVARIFQQNKKSEELLALIQSMMKELPQYQLQYKTLSKRYVRNAAELVMEEIF